MDFRSRSVAISIGFLPSQGYAGTATYGSPNTITYNAANPGGSLLLETNTVTISQGGFGGAYDVIDTTAPVVAGTGCTRVTDNHARCAGGFLVFVDRVIVYLGKRNDSVTINSTDAEASVEGGYGADTIVGGSDHDTLMGDGIRGASTFDTACAGNDRIEGRGGNDTLIGGGNVVMTGEDTCGSGRAPDVLFGGVGNDTLHGGYGGLGCDGGNCPAIETGDELHGQENDDTLNGDLGDDYLNDGGTNWDTLNGGDGSDTVDYSARTARVVIDLRNAANHGESGENDQIATVENVRGGSGGDALTGNPSSNRLEGNGGADTLNGLGSTDAYFGGAGGDTITSQDSIPESVDCGPDTDSATADGSDTTVNCETVTAPPRVDINDVTVDEAAGNAVFTVTRTGSTAQGITISYSTDDGSARVGLDYTGVGDSTTIPAGQTQTTISIPILNDSIDEPTETFTLSISSSNNADVGDGNGTGTITDNDPPPSMAIGDVTVVEGNAGDVNAVLTVTLSQASSFEVRVNYMTALEGTASPDFCVQPSTFEGCFEWENFDYRPVETPQTLVFSPGQVTKTISVPVHGDTVDEANENFFVDLSSATFATISDGRGIATIQDDELPSVSVGDAGSVTEGASASFSVTLSRPKSFSVSVTYTAANGTAQSGDYTATSAPLTFAPGETTKTVLVPTVNDSGDEPTETFVLNLSLPRPRRSATVRVRRRSSTTRTRASAWPT